jgi:hypothetical protein
MEKIRVGSEAHKELFCREFIRTHDGYEPRALVWPEIDDESRQRLASLPVWSEAMRVERATALKVWRMAAIEPDPTVAEAIALQGFEEDRHATLLDLFTQRYGLPVAVRSETPRTVDPTWAFLRTEYGECLDSFFAFGLFALARDSGFFPPSLVQVFDPVMQEEARHILFFVNWLAYRRARMHADVRMLLDMRRAAAVTLQLLDRVRTAIDLGDSEQDHFTMRAHVSFGDFSVRAFLETCRAENERRLGLYDPALLRPQLVPRVADLVLRWWPAGRTSH